MKRIYFILAGISLILFMSCARSEKGTKDTQTVKIDTVVSASSQTALQFPGKVKAAQDISLAFRVSGTIRKIYVEDGARVREGQRWPNWIRQIIGCNWMLRRPNTSRSRRKPNVSWLFIKKTGPRLMPTIKPCTA